MAILLLLMVDPLQAKTIWHWHSEFDTEEQKKLILWVQHTIHGIEDHIGAYPFDLHIFFYRRKAEEPVPWAHTERNHRQGVHFHVDPSFTLRDFLDDWTAPHELSHLILPYLGNQHSWFAEGFASYMQYQIMQTSGVISTEEASQKYSKHVKRASRNYPFPKLSLAEAAPKLRAQWDFPTMYWAGAIYFMQVDHELRNNNSSLQKVLAAYLQCCRDDGGSLTSVINALDKVSGSNIFKTNIKVFTDTPGFPKHKHLIKTH